VFAGVRDIAGRNRAVADALRAKGIEPVELDVTSDASVTAAIAALLAKSGGKLLASRARPRSMCGSKRPAASNRARARSRVGREGAAGRAAAPAAAVVIIRVMGMGPEEREGKTGRALSLNPCPA